MMNADWEPLWLTFKLSLVTTCCLLVVGIPLAVLLAEMKSRLKPVAEALISLPLVLPPSVLGFYLLLAFSPASFPGRLLSSLFDVQLVFSFQGLVVGSVIYSLPFMVHPIQAALQSLPTSLKEASMTLGKSSLVTFFRVILPNSKAALISGIVLSFAHTLGEFGLVLMIGGNIPGITRLASIAIYDEVESLNFHEAHLYSAILLSVSFLILLVVYIINRHFFTKRLF